MIINTINIQLLILVGLVGVILIIVFVTGKRSKDTITKTNYVLGTMVNLRAYGANANNAIEKSIERLNNIDDKMSVFKENSEISKINSKAGISMEKVSKDTYYVIKKAVEYSKILEGTFDPTIRPLVSLWNIGKGDEKIPGKYQIEERLKLVNYNDVILDDNNSSIMLKKIKQALDVGGIAKGFAADEVRDIFYKYKIKSALIDLGGNIFALGSKENGEPWRVGIQNPFEPRGEHIGILNIKNKSVVTSGNYERYFIKKGKMFHHILDPRTGYPSQSKIISATIISDNSIDGDGLSTGVYILGIDKAINIIECMNGIEAIFITEDKKIYTTSGVSDELFTLTNNEFSITNLNL
ncbi:thiamine biosynthesis lipoprotein [Clostridium saccharobutylicum]|uniref:FAD:protein FMN transferase n=1 Tax=Clostridium saccharobutylicum DSM 13864 TaxID=1345695 RepID=U5MQM7_CLOSA|nr:thiamine biosynthesis lipoprotein ApbE [Clostridium saccharobutylicum DSM 13864]AQR89021.1 thiamine biosynthesis lipoprotein ApbE precursor [Clostridium saccharobutylicum]AQR98922.1 thiamine biosynthesis lipoprotein ApbE precursor [Clostridium saccharobutylicum]AQS12910.1 thiamine biosynthesis lipoprotein ApbE precursor [Clostridium saccharobutylicum]MBA2903973.1 thiamine biosynthesis lipoprotein [Clostridium saccharobutylicum]